MTCTCMAFNSALPDSFAFISLTIFGLEPKNVIPYSAAHIRARSIDREERNISRVLQNVGAFSPYRPWMNIQTYIHKTTTIRGVIVRNHIRSAMDGIGWSVLPPSANVVILSPRTGWRANCTVAFPRPNMDIASSRPCKQVHTYDVHFACAEIRCRANRHRCSVESVAFTNSLIKLSISDLSVTHIWYFWNCESEFFRL